MIISAPRSSGGALGHIVKNPTTAPAPRERLRKCRQLLLFVFGIACIVLVMRLLLRVSSLSGSKKSALSILDARPRRIEAPDG
jgi:hypothetical protein